MDSNGRRLRRATTFRRAGWLAVASMVALSLVGPGASGALATTADQVFVCKYSGTPGVDEILKPGENPIKVDGSATTGTWFNDKQGRSFVLGPVTDQVPPDCPAPAGPPTTTCAPVGATGIVSFPGTIPTGWTLTVLPGTHLYSSGFDSIALPAGDYTYTWKDSGGNVTGTGSFTIAACAAPAPGSLVVTKALAGTLTGFDGGDFTFSVTCGETSYGSLTINLASGSKAADPITGIPAGAACTVTETSRADPGTFGSWGAIPAAGHATIVADTQASVTITNTRTYTPSVAPSVEPSVAPSVAPSPAGGVAGATGTPTPTGGVEAATGRPHVTPPPTDALGGTTGQPAGDTWRIALLVLAALLASLLIFSPSKTSPERRRR